MQNIKLEIWQEFGINLEIFMHWKNEYFIFNNFKVTNENPPRRVKN